MTTTTNVMNTLNVLNSRQKLGIVLMALLITVLYPVVALMIVLTIGVVYYVTHRDQKKQEFPQQLIGIETDKSVGSGSDTKKIKFCTNCGEVIGDNNKFCGNCGQNVVI